jgi:hypothetical protein
MRTRLKLLSFPLLLAACAHDDLTAREHRQLAATEQGRATVEQARYQPELSTERPSSMDHLVKGDDNGTFTYNPTQSHLINADRELRDAADNLAAAKRIEAFEDTACRELTPAQRAACPLLASQVLRVRHTEHGFTLLLADSTDAGATFARLSCHLAWARSVGFDRPSCPLFVRGTQLRRVGDHSLEFSADDPATASELQAQARHIFLGAP